MSDSQSYFGAVRTTRCVRPFMGRILLLFLLFLLVAPIHLVFGQQPDASASLSGTVRDSHGDPAADAEVQLQCNDPAKPVSIRTDAEGKYRFSNLPPGVYSLSASLRDLRAKTGSIVVSLHEKKSANLTLAPADKSAASTMQPQFSDEPQFTVAGVKDATNLAGHGSDVVIHSRNNLAKETASLGTFAGAESAAAAGEAAKSLRARLEREPNNAEIHHQLASLEEQLGDPLEAVSQYQRAAELNPTEPYLFDWGSELLLHHAPVPAIEVFSKGSHSFPHSVRMLLGLGAAQFALGFNDRAVKTICEASDLSPGDPAPYLFLGRMLGAEKTVPTDTVEKLHRFATLHPDNAEGNYYYAVALWKQQPENSRASEVKSLLNRAIQFDPKFAAAYLQLGIVHSDRHENSQALAAFEKAAQADPQMEEAHYRLARVYRQLGENDKSKTEMQAYERLSHASEQEAERERHEIRQFVYTLRDRPVDDKSH